MKNLRKLRQEASLSQQALASHFNISQQAIYKYENDLAEPDITMLKNLASFFGVSVDYLIGNAPVPARENENGSLPALSLTAAETELLRKIRLLPPNVRNALAAFVENLAGDKQT